VKFVILLFFGIIQLTSCQLYRIAENKYQADADIVRVKHFDYYAQLLTEYYLINGKYPFQYEKDSPVYVYIMTDIQAKDYGSTDPYIHYTVDDNYFFEELSIGLGREIYEKYDPQKVAADSRPNMYVYMVHNENFFFAIHLYRGNQFTKKIAKYYYKMELSNLDIDNDEYKFYSYETLKNNPRYQELINKENKKQGFFDKLDEQNKSNSRK
jgi:hypothetical protein